MASFSIPAEYILSLTEGTNHKIKLMFERTEYLLALLQNNTTFSTPNEIGDLISNVA